MEFGAVKKSETSRTLVYHPATHPKGESTMDIFVSENDEKLSGNKDRDPLWFYMNPTFSHPGLRINYIPLSITSTTVSNSSQSKVSFPFPSSELKINFGSFGSLSSKSKVRNGRYIPHEVAFSIFKKLSIKSLKRFECVCKSWSILFENNDFMTMYSKHFISRHASDDDYNTFIYANHCTDDKGYRYRPELHLIEKRLKLNLPSPVEKFGNRTCILGSTSVNGIFCFGLSGCRLFYDVQYVLWNPLTEQFMVIPSSPAQLTRKFPNDGYNMVIIFHGLGYDQLRDDFKVIQYVSLYYSDFDCDCCEGKPNYFFETYSLKSKSWTTIDMEDTEDDNHGMRSIQTESFDGREVYVDGVCHWLASEYTNHLHTMTMLSFDFSDEVFIKTPIGKKHYSRYSKDLHLTVVNGSVALISSNDKDIVFHIFILGELGASESWIKLYIYGPLLSIQWPPIGFGKMGYIFFTNEDNEVAYVDLSTQITEEVGDITGGENNYYLCGLYKESKPSFDRRIK